MASSSEAPKFAWKRRLNQTLEDPGNPKRLPFFDMLDLAPMLLRMRSYVKDERNAGREPAMDPFNPIKPGPVGGAPLGGIGGGSIMRGWQGDFSRWQLQPGNVSYQHVAADQFSVFIQRKTDRPIAQVLTTHLPEQGELRGWGWGLTGQKTTYNALFPRAWTVYEEPDPKLRLTCRQVSPVLPDNYQESSTPASVFVWTIENTGKDAATVGVMFTFQNGTGGENDRTGGHSNHFFQEKAKGGDVIGVALRHTHRQERYTFDGGADGQDGQYEDPLTFAIAAQQTKGVEVTYRTRFVANSSGMDLWGDFRDDGRLEDVIDDRPSTPGTTLAAGVCATVVVPPGETREVTFALAWDMPLARAGGGKAYYRRYTHFYGRSGDAAPAMARDALLNYETWEKQIEAWQAPVLKETGLPDWFKAALFNELYYLVDGGTLWTDGAEHEKPLKDGEYGHFGYMESLEYRFINTVDVHFYSSFALAMLWPQLELSIQRDVAAAIDVEDPAVVRFIGSGKTGLRKIGGAVPHDLGSYVEDPWGRVNSYVFQDTSRWKDLNSKFVLQVYRDVIATGDKKFAADMWEPVVRAMAYLGQADLDEDGLIENEGYPDQTYDMWTADGPSAYSGGLWLAALSATAALADMLKKKDEAAGYRELLEKGKTSYEELLWNGAYYNYDASRSHQHNSIMADQLAGHWYTRACGLPGFIPDGNAKTALATIYEYNVAQFEDGEMGAVNGMRPDGRVDLSSMQSSEVWTGTTYALAASMLQEGMDKQAWATAEGIAAMTYRELGYWFQTPEAWDYTGDYRALGYMRPLSIWSMWWAWDRERKTKKKSSG